MEFANPILQTVLEDDSSPTGGISFAGETLEDFIKEDEKLLYSYMKVSELNKYLIECGIKPIKHSYKCGGCCCCEPRDRKDETGCHCTMQDYQKDIDPEEEACFWYWDRNGQEKIDRAEAEKDEQERQKKWEENKDNPPVKLPIVFDGYGRIPMCPTCGDMPYSTEQCYWCGQRFFQDEDIEEYNTISEETITCPFCGKQTMVGARSKYNNHFHGKCTNCGAMMME